MPKAYLNHLVVVNAGLDDFENFKYDFQRYLNSKAEEGILFTSDNKVELVNDCGHLGNHLKYEHGVLYCGNRSVYGIFKTYRKPMKSICNGLLTRFGDQIMIDGTYMSLDPERKKAGSYKDDRFSNLIELKVAKESYDHFINYYFDRYLSTSFNCKFIHPE